MNQALRVIISEENFGKESFIRWGPVERVRQANRDRVGVFHWIHTEELGFSSESVEPVFDEIESFINTHVSSSPETMAYPDDKEVSIFYDIIWILYLADAITPARLLELVQRRYPDLSQNVLRRKIYTLLVAKWVLLVPFGGQDYYCLKSQSDPFIYSFHEGTVDKEPLRRVLSIRENVFGRISPNVLRRINERRESAL